MFCNDKLESVILIDLSLAKPIGTFVPPEVTHTGDVSFVCLLQHLQVIEALCEGGNIKVYCARSLSE